SLSPPVQLRPLTEETAAAGKSSLASRLARSPAAASGARTEQRESPRRHGANLAAMLQSPRYPRPDATRTALPAIRLVQNERQASPHPDRCAADPLPQCGRVRGGLAAALFWSVRWSPPAITLRVTRP